jgi:hypothetical protein
MIRFWFPVPGHFGIGVTAESLAEATRIATAFALDRGWALDARLVEQNVDVAALDPDHVVPCLRLGDVAQPGVWFPR